MKSDMIDKIRKANRKHMEYLSVCDKIAKEAQEHIDWNDRVSCEYYPGEGICIEIEEHVCCSTTFFDLVEEVKDGMIDRETYIRNSI